MIGFVRVLGNPSVLLLWVTLTATFLSHNWVDDTLDDRVACVMGVASGASLWFLLLAYVVSRGHGRISPRVLLRMEHVSGALLLAAALWIGGRIIWQLHKQHQHERAIRRRDAISNPDSSKSSDLAFAYGSKPQANTFQILGLAETSRDDRARALSSAAPKIFGLPRPLASPHEKIPLLSRARNTTPRPARRLAVNALRALAANF